MLRKRDKEIIEALSLFRCLSRDQIAFMFFSNLKSPITSTNHVLKRLRRESYIVANTERQPYIYFLNPPSIKIGSQKINHYLAIADFYISVCKEEKPKVFRVEPRYGGGFMQPDIFMIWKNNLFFIEIQNSIYSSEVMNGKINRYIDYYYSDEWRYKHLQNETISEFPLVWIISKKTSYLIPKNEIKVIQTKDVNSFLASAYI
ncbi:replication-relaxation family protein [Priestia megaterium]|uniref:replication-relaxation family protein n=1 Tax=Priestia megaterium TaxID=1404 RepID=UPI000BFB2AD4|nr:replication-relaxation family protein [Priestia megaterium]PGX77759.1 hypothetical protein COE31_12145 [Priestia megaterium]